MVRALLVLAALLVAQTASAQARGPQPTITCPSGAVRVAPGSGANIQNAIKAYPAGTTICLSAGVYYITAPITPKSGNTFIGEYGAILDGSQWITSDDTQGAFRALNQDIDFVTIRNLVIRSMPQKAITAYYWMSDHWTVEYNELASNKYGVEVAPDSVIRHNYIHHNTGNPTAVNPSQRGGGYIGHRADRVLFENNEIAYNGPEQKILLSVGVTFRNNFVHHNYFDGIWFDTNPVSQADNSQALVEGNTVEDNGRDGISIEATNGATVRNNTIRRNQEAVLVYRSQNTQIVGNVMEANGFAIQYFTSCDGLPGEELQTNNAHDNKITVPAGGYANGFTSAICTPEQLVPYLTNTKRNLYTRNTYIVPGAGAYWLWGTPKTWQEWQGLGFDNDAATPGPLPPPNVRLVGS